MMTAFDDRLEALYLLAEEVRLAGLAAGAAVRDAVEAPSRPDDVRPIPQS